MTSHRDVPTPAENSLAAFVTNALPHSENEANKLSIGKAIAVNEGELGGSNVNNLSPKQDEDPTKINNNNTKCQVNLQDGQNLVRIFVYISLDLADNLNVHF